MYLRFNQTWQLFRGYLALFVIVFSNLAVLADRNVFTDPGNQSVWSVVGPNGGDVRVVTIDPRDKNRLYHGQRRPHHAAACRPARKVHCGKPLMPLK